MARHQVTSSHPVPAPASIRAASLARGRGPVGAPPYPNRAVPLDDALRAEFGVEDTHSLVRALNALRTAAGERPIPAGDYPSNKRGLNVVVADMRARRASRLTEGD